jgi:hypothetical protein
LLNFAQSLSRFVDQDVVKVGFFFEASVGAREVAIWLLVWLVKDEHSVQAEFVRVLEMDSVANLGEVGNPADQSDIPQDRYAAAIGGLKSLFLMNFSIER